MRVDGAQLRSEVLELAREICGVLITGLLNVLLNGLGSQSGLRGLCGLRGLRGSCNRKRD